MVGNSMSIRKNTSEKAFDAIIYFAIFLLACITVWPFIYVFSMSVSAPGEVIKQSVWLYPKGFILDSYAEIVKNNYIWRTYANTVFYVISGTFLNCIISFLSAYSLARLKSRIKRFIVMYMMFTMFFSGGIIPYFIVINKIGLYDNFLIMIIPAIVSVWNIIIVRTHIKALPEALLESAKIDGAGELRILSQIVFPMSKSILAVIILYTAVFIWNNWFNALIFLQDRNWHPLQYYLARVLVFGSPDLIKNVSAAENFENTAAVMIQIKYAAIIFVSLPIICVYPFLQKYFVKGVLIGTLKE